MFGSFTSKEYGCFFLLGSELTRIANQTITGKIEIHPERLGESR